MSKIKIDSNAFTYPMPMTLVGVLNLKLAPVVEMRFTYSEPGETVPATEWLTQRWLRMPPCPGRNPGGTVPARSCHSTKGIAGWFVRRFSQSSTVNPWPTPTFNDGAAGTRKTLLVPL